MIEAKGLTKVYGGKTAVAGVSFTVQPGLVTGFLGPNGAGKSTTMRMVMGLDRPTSGSVTVNGLPTRSTRRRCMRLARCWMPRPSTRAAVRTTTCLPWPPPTAFQKPGSRKSLR
jgi:ABC-type Mn2+/Zn2+ transport system ATPase subunit